MWKITQAHTFKEHVEKAAMAAVGAANDANGHWAAASGCGV